MYICISSGAASNSNQDFIDSLLVPACKELSKEPILLIGNALDGSTNTIIQMQMLKKTALFLESLGLQVEYLDLTDYFEREQLLEKKLAHVAGVYFEDGNPFVLRAALAESGLDRILKSYSVRKTPFMCFGSGAGAIVLSSSLKGFEQVYNNSVLPERYQTLGSSDGLALLPYVCVPHFRSDHKTAQSMNLALEYNITHKVLFKALRDGDAILENTIT